MNEAALVVAELVEIEWRRNEVFEVKPNSSGVVLLAAAAGNAPGLSWRSIGMNAKGIVVANVEHAKLSAGTLELEDDPKR
jgi:hypothetical protein